MHTYRKSEHEQLLTVGYVDGEGTWYLLTDFAKEREAMERVNYLNGGNSHVTAYTVEP